tara:strand:- start:97 stop:561 length:465 start_codon:yes stop_codon:yes gene_type:complete
MAEWAILKAAIRTDEPTGSLAAVKKSQAGGEVIAHSLQSLFDLLVVGMLLEIALGHVITDAHHETKSLEIVGVNRTLLGSLKHHIEQGHLVVVCLSVSELPAQSRRTNHGQCKCHGEEGSRSEPRHLSALGQHAENSRDSYQGQQTSVSKLSKF